MKSALLSVLKPTICLRNSIRQCPRGQPRSDRQEPRLHPPHKWAVGTTFEWEFEFPMSTNSAYELKPEPKRKTRKRANPKPAPTRARDGSSRKAKSIREAEASPPHVRGTAGTSSCTNR